MLRKTHQILRAFWGRRTPVGVFLGALMLSGGLSEAAQVKLLNVRSSRTGDRLRIVFDLSQMTPYTVLRKTQADGADLLTISFSNMSPVGLPEVLKLPGTLTLKFEKQGSGEVIGQIQFPSVDVLYRHFHLKKPFRLVLDLSLGPDVSWKSEEDPSGPLLVAPVQVASPTGFDSKTKTRSLMPYDIPQKQGFQVAGLSPLLFAPPMKEEMLAPISRRNPKPRQEGITETPKTEQETPKSPSSPESEVTSQPSGEEEKVWGSLFERPPLPELTPGEPDASEFAKALDLYFDGKGAEAAKAFSQLVRKFPKSRLAPAAAYLSGDSYFEAKPSPKVEKKETGKEEKKTAAKNAGSKDQDSGKNKPPSAKEIRLSKRQLIAWAAEAYQKALRDYGADEWTPWGLLQLGRTQSELGLFFRAETTFQELRERYPDHPLSAVAAAQVGFTNLKLGDAELALEIFNDVLDHPKASVYARALATYGLAGVHFKLKKIKLAKSEFEKALKTAPTLVKYSPDILFLMGETFLASGDFAKARGAYENQIELFPDSGNIPFVMTRIAESHFLEKDLENATVRFAEVIEKYPDTESSTISRLRLADLALEDPEFAKKSQFAKIPSFRDPLGAYREVAERGSPRTLAELAWLRLGEEALRRKKYADAHKAFRTMADEFAKGRLYGRALFGLESALIGLMDEKFGQQDYLEVLRLFHSEEKRGLRGLIKVATLMKVAASYRQVDLFDKAEEILDRVDISRATPREREDIEIMKIEGLITQARWKILEPALKKYLKEYPEGRFRAKAVSSLAEVLVQEERWDEASRFLEKSIPELDEGVERARMEHLLARVYTKGERHALAVDALREAIRMVPDKRPTPVFLADAYYLLGENLMSLGQYQDAAEVLKAGAERFPDDALQGWALYEAGTALQQVGQSEAASKALKELSSTHTSDFWGRMVQALKKDIDWWQKHEQLRK